MILTREEIEKAQHNIIGIGILDEVREWAAEQSQISTERCFHSYAPATNISDDEVLQINFKEAILFALRVGINAGRNKERELYRMLESYKK